MKNQQAYISLFVAYLTFQSSNQEHQPGMTTVFHARPYDRFIEIQSSLRNKKLHITNQGSNFLGGSFINRDNIKAPI